MKPSLTVVTLGVRDLKRSLDFYRNVLGWSTSSTEADGIIFFQLKGVVLALYPRKSLAEDATVEPKGSGFSGLTLAHNASSENEVDAIFGELKVAGARIVKAPQKAFWGGIQRLLRRPGRVSVGGRL